MSKERCPSHGHDCGHDCVSRVEHGVSGGWVEKHVKSGVAKSSVERVDKFSKKMDAKVNNHLDKHPSERIGSNPHTQKAFTAGHTARSERHKASGWAAWNAKNKAGKASNAKKYPAAHKGKD